MIYSWNGSSILTSIILMNKKIIVSVVIPVYNDNRVFLCLDSLTHQSISRDSYEIILVENWPLRQYEESTRKYWIKYIYSKPGNMSIARNIWQNIATWKYTFFTDADCVIDNHRLEEWISFLDKRHDLVWFGWHILPYKETTVTEKFWKNLAWGQTELQYLKHISPFPYVVFANAWFRTQALLEIWWSDDDLRSWCDVDICWKLYKKWYLLWVCPWAIISHKNRQSVRSYFKAYVFYAVYQALLFKRYSSKKIVINTYPRSLLINALWMIVRWKLSNLRWRYNIIEAVAIIYWDIKWSLLFKTFYF